MLIKGHYFTNDKHQNKEEVVQRITELDKQSQIDLIRELAPRYYEKIILLPSLAQKMALSEKEVAGYIQRRVNQMKDNLSQANEAYREYDNLRKLSLHTGEYLISIEW